MDMDRWCRTCFVYDKPGFLIFGKEGRRLHLLEKARRYVGLEITRDDNLPKMVCLVCVETLNNFHTFANTSIINQEKMINFFLAKVAGVKEQPEPDKGASTSLLHTYLTKDIPPKEPVPQSEEAAVEVRVDPMTVLQCCLGEDEDIDDSFHETPPEVLILNESIDDSFHETPPDAIMELSDSMDDSFNNSSPILVTVERVSTDEDDEGSFHESSSENENCENTCVIYMCTICKRKFGSELGLQEHMQVHYSPHTKRILNACNSDHENIVSTQGCTSSCGGTKSSEPQDVKCEEFFNVLSCPICGRFVSSKEILKVHLETHRPKGKYGCDICGRVFKTQCNLFRHKEYHEGIQFPCEVCGRVYPTNSTLRAHSITHSDLRPHKCPLCDKTFKRNQDLKFHINQHTGARPYQCPYCPKAFASSGNCFSHRKRMHPIEVERDKERAAKIMR